MLAALVRGEPVPQLRTYGNTTDATFDVKDYAFENNAIAYQPHGLSKFVNMDGPEMLKVLYGAVEDDDADAMRDLSKHFRALYHSFTRPRLGGTRDRWNTYAQELRERHAVALLQFLAEPEDGPDFDKERMMETVNRNLLLLPNEFRDVYNKCVRRRSVSAPK